MFAPGSACVGDLVGFTLKVRVLVRSQPATGSTFTFEINASEKRLGLQDGKELTVVIIMLICTGSRRPVINGVQPVPHW
jgi:hypothetical protein